MPDNHLDAWISEMPNMQWMILNSPFRSLFEQTPPPTGNREVSDEQWQNLIGALESSTGSEPPTSHQNNQENPS